MDAPRIVSLAVADEVQERWDEVRRAHFPQDRLVVGAHVTLFHALPPGLDVDATLAAAASEREPFTVRVAEVVPLGRGTALRLESDELRALHRDLQQRWSGHLTKQDAHGLHAHVTVQNKVGPEQARETLEQLREDFTAYDVAALGLDLWRYDGGPWTRLRRFAFAS